MQIIRHLRTTLVVWMLLIICILINSYTMIFSRNIWHIVSWATLSGSFVSPTSTWGNYVCRQTKPPIPKISKGCLHIGLFLAVSFKGMRNFYMNVALCVSYENVIIVVLACWLRMNGCLFDTFASVTVKRRKHVADYDIISHILVWSSALSILYLAIPHSKCYSFCGIGWND